jgi:hypothetical protein
VSGYNIQPQLAPFNTSIASNHSICVEECTNNGNCYLASYTESNGNCSLYELNGNEYAFVSPGITLYMKQLNDTGYVDNKKKQKKEQSGERGDLILIHLTVD